MLCVFQLFREIVRLLIWGLCRQELPPEMFTCDFCFCLFCVFTLVFLYVSRKDLSFLCILQIIVYELAERATFSEDAFLIKKNIYINNPDWFVLSVTIIFEVCLRLSTHDGLVLFLYF